MVVPCETLVLFNEEPYWAIPVIHNKKYKQCTSFHSKILGKKGYKTLVFIIIISESLQTHDQNKQLLLELDSVMMAAYIYIHKTLYTGKLVAPNAVTDALYEGNGHQDELVCLIVK